MQLHVMVRSNGSVITATFAPQIIDDVVALAADALPLAVQRLDEDSRRRFICERVALIMSREKFSAPDSIGVAALAVLYAHLDGGAAVLRDKIDQAFADGQSPLLGIGLTEGVCASLVSVDHGQTYARLKNLIEQLSRGDASNAKLH